MKGHDDQRSFYRMMVNAECKLTVLDAETTQTYNAVCRDLSANGMAVEVDSALDGGKQVEISITSTNSQIPSLKAEGKILRCSQESDAIWLLGIEISEIN